MDRSGSRAVPNLRRIKEHIQVKTVPQISMAIAFYCRVRPQDCEAIEILKSPHRIFIGYHESLSLRLR